MCWQYAWLAGNGPICTLAGYGLGWTRAAHVLVWPRVSYGLGFLLTVHVLDW